MGMEDFPLPDEAAGLLGMASRSMSWSCRETMALAAEIRSGAGEFGSSAISDMVTADRRRRRTICAGKVALATANTVPVRFSLLLRLFGLTSGVNLSRLGMTDNDRQHTDFNQCLPASDRGPEKEVLTRKAVYETLAPYSMNNETKQDWIAKLKELAFSRYETAYGYQVFIECYDTSDWVELIEDCKTYEEAEAKTVRIAWLLTSRYDDACAEIF